MIYAFNHKKIDFQIKSLGVYLFKSLPLNCWIPTEDDFGVMAMWLLNSNIDSTESISARTIIGHLNWNLNK